MARSMGGRDGRAGGVWAWAGRGRLMFRMMALLYPALAVSANRRIRPATFRSRPVQVRSARTWVISGGLAALGGRPSMKSLFAFSLAAACVASTLAVPEFALAQPRGDYGYDDVCAEQKR